MKKQLPMIIYNPTYHKTLNHTLQALSTMQQTLFSAAINLATQGKWKTWNANQPEDAEFTFTEDMLCNTGDEKVDTIMNLYFNLLETKEKLERGPSLGVGSGLIKRIISFILIIQITVQTNPRNGPKGPIFITAGQRPADRDPSPPRPEESDISVAVPPSGRRLGRVFPSAGR
jgi:hypothetical protein